MQPMIKPESTMARQVARAVMAFQQKTTGHAPKAVTVVLSQDTLVVTLHEALDDATRRIVLEELRDKVFNPKILSISHCKREFDVTRITAQTDRGEVTFQLRTRDDVRVLSEGRALFRDVDGNTYELADLQQLDPSSRKHLSEFF